MAVLLHPSTYLQLLHCPCSNEGSLAYDDGVVRCEACSRTHRVSDGGILELVDPSTLSAETARELSGNTYNLTEKQVAHLMLAERMDAWQTYYSRSRKRSLRQLHRYLDDIDSRQVFSLGSGTGREILYLLRFRTFDTVFCSDLSHSALRMIPERLRDADLQLGLFTSNLENCPVRTTEIPILIVNALHHTTDMHQSLDKLLAQNHRNILLVEPTNNLAIRFLARRGLARRVEYSGILPGRLELRQVRALAKRHGYKPAITTMWAMPDDYFRKLNRRVRFSPRLFLALVDILSGVTNPFKLGNVSVIHLHKWNRSSK